MPASYDSNSLPASVKEGYQHFLKNEFKKNKDLFAALEEEGQSPKALWIGCVDSRVSPDKILRTKPGDLLILRNVANIVPPYAADEASLGSALYFASKNLKVEHIIVCGHSDCGGVKALSHLGSRPMDRMLSSWVEYSVSALEDNQGSDLESLIKANVLLQTERLCEYPCVKEESDRKALAIHAFYYDIGTGKLEYYDGNEKAWAGFS